jgi:cation transport regulator ChaB
MLTLANGDITTLTAKSAILLNNFNLTNTEQEHVFSAESLAIDNIVLHHDNQPNVEVEVEVDHILINTLEFSSKDETSELVNGEKLPSIMKLKQIAINDIKANDQNLSVNTITLDQLLSHIIINKNKELINLVNLSKKEEADTTEEMATTDAEAVNAASDTVNDPARQSTQSEFTFSLNKFQMINNNEIFFVDHSVEPAYNADLFIDTLALKNINNSPETQLQPSPFIFEARNNKYATLNFTGFIKPFAPTPVYKVVGHFKEMSLPAITSYLKDATGLEIKTGQLNLDMNLTLTGDMIDGETELLLQGLETAVYDDDEVDSLIAEGALPLNIAMGMLKDGDGNIELGFPLSGSTSNPEFGLSSIITMISKKVIVDATQDYLVKTFVPYANIVSLAMTAGEYALKLRFDDLPYKVKQVIPDENQHAFLTEFISLMQNKENTRVNICAISTPQDINLEAGKKINDKADKQRLINLGAERANALKDYLIEQGKIDSSRMLLCKPQIDSSKDALPRITISV